MYKVHVSCIYEMSFNLINNFGSIYVQLISTLFQGGHVLSTCELYL